MSEQSDALADALPSGFYDRVAPFLHLCGMGCLQFFSRPDDPLPREITDLTGLDLASARMITAINSTDMLTRQLLEEPELFYVHLLVGSLVLGGPLAVPVLRFLEQNMQLDAEQTAAIRQHLLPFGETFVELVGKFAAHDDEEARADLYLLRLQIEGAFARLADTLQTTELPATAPGSWAAETDEEDCADDELEDEDDEFIFEIKFREEQLHMLRLAVTLARVLPSLSEQPFAQAVAQLSGCTPTAVARLNARLHLATEQTPTPMTWRDVALLYQSTQVLAMALVSNVLDVLRWEQEMSAAIAEAVPSPAANEVNTLPADDELALTPQEHFARRQEIICMMITGFVECVQEHFADEPRLAELRAEVVALADLL